jgi:hypothetical protein
MYLRKSNETEFNVYTVGKMKFVIFQVTGVFVEAEVITAGIPQSKRSKVKYAKLTYPSWPTIVVSLQIQ